MLAPATGIDARVAWFFVPVWFLWGCCLVCVRSTSPSVYDALAVGQFTLVCVSAWRVGARALAANAEEIRRLSVAGGLLVTSWALLSFLPGIGPPGDQTHAENALRYLILLVDSIAVTGGLVVLSHALTEAGERFYSTLGFTAIVLAAPPYLIWAAIMVAYFLAADLIRPGAPPSALLLLQEVLDILLFVGGALTYVATAAFAVSLGRIQWIGPRATRALVGANLVALLCLVVRGMQFPVRAVALTHWSTIPGFVVGIPAVPWIMPLMFGVVLLWRAGAGHS